MYRILDLNDDCLVEIFARLKLNEKLSLANTGTRFRRAFEMSCKPYFKEVSIVGDQCRIIHNVENDSDDVTFTVVSSEHLFKVASNFIEVFSINRYTSPDLKIPKLPNLQKLKLRECHLYSCASLIRTFRKFNFIKSLELRFNKELGPHVMMELVANGMNLQHLTIDTKDDHANLDIVTLLPNLNSLDVNIGRRTLRSLLTALSDSKADQLKSLIIRSNDCSYRDVCLTTNLRKLKRIVFSNPGRCFGCVHAFQKLCELQDLEEVHLYNFEQTVDETGALFLMANCVNLKNLSIRLKTGKLSNFIYRIIQTLRKRNVPLKQPIGLDLLNYTASFEEKIMMEEANDVLTTRSFWRESHIDDYSLDYIGYNDDDIAIE